MLTCVRIAVLGLCVFLLGAQLLPQTAAAQEASRIEPNTRVRISAMTWTSKWDRNAKGVVVASSADSVTVRHDGDGRLVTLGWTDVASVEVSAGRVRRKDIVGYSSLAGALLGGVAGMTVGSRCEGDWSDLCDMSNAFLGGSIGMIAGIGFGLALPPPERWRSFDIPLKVGVAPGGRNRIGVSLTF
jgi:hypothetical protein